MFGINFVTVIGIGIMVSIFSTITVIAALVVSGREQEYEERRELSFVSADSSHRFPVT